MVPFRATSSSLSVMLAKTAVIDDELTAAKCPRGGVAQG